ncbi:uncharacterized protein LOC115620883 isoform X2 [Scaptodrosophila lebanonensis]|uniref:Uncharacterized protein LOC115620883 isoform X2 n=1 Tax=Drosophila lebanonensis TaxID=7225 RepID=A0A6J2T5L2_DROLE|nr:uncharacterized protein LOC115620883 isoform X2 [Scaptodrosophila lebanonensis]
MDLKKKRSSLRKLPQQDDEETRITALKRRVSFSGKKFVREFHDTETERWQTSYELSDHVSDSTGQRSSSISNSSIIADAEVPKSAQRSLLSVFDKENIPLSSDSVAQKDMSLRLQRSTSFTLLPEELLKARRPFSAVEVDSRFQSFSQSEVGLANLHNATYSYQETTLDLVDNTVFRVDPSKAGIFMASKDCREECMTANVPLSTSNTISKEENTCASANNVAGSSDSLMDITLLPHVGASGPQTSNVAEPSPPKERREQHAASDSFMDVTPLGMVLDTKLQVPDVSTTDKQELKSTEGHQKVIVKQIAITRNQEKEKQKTRIFEEADLDISFDSPYKARTMYPEPPKYNNASLINDASFALRDISNPNSLMDDSLMSTSVIALEPGVSKKLNMQQMNDDIESGRIKIFPKGPKTPSTDRKNNLLSTWSRVNYIDNDSQTVDFIKKRCTLNFSLGEDMKMSPERKEDSKIAPELAIEKVTIAEKENQKNKYRVSQADERMLNNTSFLIHAKLGDETVSQDSSKFPSRRETTYYNTSLELDDLSKQQEEVSTIETISKPRKTSHLTQAMEEGVLVPPTDNIGTIKPSIPVHTSAQDALKLRHTMHINQTMDEEALEPIINGTEMPANDVIEKLVQPRQTLNIAEAMDEVTDVISTQTPPSRELRNISKPRQTMHVNEAMEETLLDPDPNEHIICESINGDSTQPSTHANENHSKPRQTIHVNEAMEETLQDPDQSKDIDVDFIQTASPKTENRLKSRQSLHITKAMEETLQSPCNDIESQPINEEYIGTYTSYSQMNDNLIQATSSTGEKKHRQTVYTTEEMEESLLSVSHNVSEAVKEKSTKCRQTLHAAEPINEENSDEKLSIVNHIAVGKAETGVKLRHTIYTIEAMDEETISPKPKDNITKATESRLKSRQTLNLIETIEDSFLSPPNVNSNALLSTAHKTILEVTPYTNPKRKIGQLTPYTPARSILEFEDIEEQCMNTSISGIADLDLSTAAPNKHRSTLFEVKDIEFDDAVNHIGNQIRKTNISRIPSPSPLVARKNSINQLCQPVDMDIDMDSSIKDLPALGNTKRLPIHLTPHLPIAKKRHTLIFADNYISDASTKESPVALPHRNENCDTLEFNLSSRTMHPLTPNNKSKSRIPVLVNKSNMNSPLEESLMLAKDINEEDYSVQVPRHCIAQRNRSVFQSEEPQPDDFKNMDETKFMDFKLTPEEEAIILDENPITISDVSEYFLPQRKFSKNPPIVEALKDNSTDRSRRNSNELRFQKMTQINTNLTIDVTLFDAKRNEDLSDIENERISLVSSLENSDGHKDNKDTANEDDIPEIGDPNACEQSMGVSAVACKKCKHCRRSLPGTDSSFALPQESVFPDLGMEELRRLRQKPSITDVHKFWDLKELQRFSNVQDDSTNENGTDKDIAALEEVFDWFHKSLERILSKPTPMKFPIGKAPFCQRLENLLQSQSANWIFDYQLQFSKKYIFTNRLIPTLRIFVNYEPIDLLETAVHVCSIEVDSRKEHVASFNVHEHLHDFQLKLKLPLNLMEMLEGNDEQAFLQFLSRVDQICCNVRTKCRDMNRVLISTQARLLREGNITVARKYLRNTVEANDYIRVDSKEFVVQIANIDEVSFKDILRPHLYLYNEDIQYLPKGTNFLKLFFENPAQHLKSKS